MISDSQLRWLGPEKGVMHMAIGAVINAAWDLAAALCVYRMAQEQKLGRQLPLWQSS